MPAYNWSVDMATVERTLVLLKPDAVARGLVGRVLQRFEDAGLKVVGTKMVQMDADLARKHGVNECRRRTRVTSTPFRFDLLERPF